MRWSHLCSPVSSMDQVTRHWTSALTMPMQDKLLTMDPKEITYEMVNKKLQEIVLSRGKKGIDRQDQVEMLSYLATVAKGPYQKVLDLC